MSAAAQRPPSRMGYGEDVDADAAVEEDDEEAAEISDEDYVEPHIEVPGIPYMAADAEGGSHMEECHRARARTARSRLEKLFWPGEQRTCRPFMHSRNCICTALTLADHCSRAFLLPFS